MSITAFDTALATVSDASSTIASEPVLLVGPVTTEFVGRVNMGQPPLGVHRIAGFLRARNIDVDVWDSNLDERPFADILQSRPYRTIGFSLIHDSVSSDTYTLAGSYFLIHEARRLLPDALLIAGGPEAAEDFGTVLAKTPVNCVCLGEGEAVMLSLLQGAPVHTIPGLIWRNYAQPMTQDRLWSYYDALDWGLMGHRPLWEKTAHLYPHRDWRQLSSVRVIPTTHCVRNCTFCSIRGVDRMVHGRNTRPISLSGEQLYELISRVKRQIPDASMIYFCNDDIFSVPAPFLDFCERYLQEPLGLSFLVQTSSYNLTEDRVEVLRRIGCWHITVGVENASARIRKSLGKPQNAQRIEDIIEWCVSRQIMPYYLIILFCPEITVEDLEINVEKINEWIRRGVTVSVEPYMMPYKSAPIWESDYRIDHQILTIKGTGEKLKQATMIWPADPDVREIMVEFRRRLPAFLDEGMKKLGHDHRYKGATGAIMIQLLADILESR